MASKADKLAAGLFGNTNLNKTEVLNLNKVKLQTLIDDGTIVHQDIRLENIVVNPKNDYAEQDTSETISLLADDIERNGLLHNIVVSLREDGTYLLLSGERRVKAYKLLLERTKDNKYSAIFALVKKGLDALGEEIILDAANLQVRGNFNASETRTRKSSVRFVNNLKRKFSISEEDAIELTLAISESSEKAIKTNIMIENTFNAGLRELLDTKKISKTIALSLSKLSESEQSEIYNILAPTVNTETQLKEKLVEVVQKIKQKSETEIAQKKRAMRAGQGSEANNPVQNFSFMDSPIKANKEQDMMLKISREIKKISANLQECENLETFNNLSIELKGSVCSDLNELIAQAKRMLEKIAEQH